MYVFTGLWWRITQRNRSYFYTTGQMVLNTPLHWRQCRWCSHQPLHCLPRPCSPAPTHYSSLPSCSLCREEATSRRHCPPHCSRRASLEELFLPDVPPERHSSAGTRAMRPGLSGSPSPEEETSGPADTGRHTRGKTDWLAIPLESILCVGMTPQATTSTAYLPDSSLISSVRQGSLILPSLVTLYKISSRASHVINYLLQL